MRVSMLVASLDATSGSVMANAERKSVPTRNKERTRALILAAATEEFAEKGFAGARIEQIAERSGSNKRMLYYYFNNKDKSWDLISKWKTHSSEKELSFSVGFVEDFMRNFESAKKARGAFFGPSFAYKDGKWHPNTSVTFTGDPTPSTNVMANIQPDGSVLLQTGGTTKMTDFKLFQNRPLPQNIKLVLPDKAVTSLVQENIN